MSNGSQNIGKMTPEEVRTYLDCTEKGTVKNTLQNCVTVLQKDEKLRDLIRYNSFTERIDVTEKAWWEKSGTVLNDTDLNYLLL